MQQTEKFYYTRTKNVVPTDSGPELFLFAGLIRELAQPLGTSTRNKVEPIFSEMIEEPYQTCKPIYRELPNETIHKEISYETMLQLEKLAKTDLQSFFLFEPK